jgi:hypothetical protein
MSRKELIRKKEGTDNRLPAKKRIYPIFIANAILVISYGSDFISQIPMPNTEKYMYFFTAFLLSKDTHPP